MMKRILALLLALALPCAACLAEGTPAPAASEAPPAATMPVAEDEPVEDPALRLTGVRIGIDPGHQAHANSEKEPIAPGSRETKPKVASGTSGRATGIAEYVTDLEIAFKLRDALLAEGAEVYMTRESHDVDISNRERAMMMNKLGVDLVLRIHCDGAEKSSVHGIGLYVTKTGPIAESSLAAAKCILPRMLEATGAAERGIFQRDTYTGQNWSVVPCIMVECGYMSNREEDFNLNTPAYQQKLADGMVEGICDWLGR